jgi:hypothetical protein
MDTVRIVFFLGELYGLSCCACDMMNNLRAVLHRSLDKKMEIGVEEKELLRCQECNEFKTYLVQGCFGIRWMCSQILVE